jgi:hypothetical protein
MIGSIGSLTLRPLITGHPPIRRVSRTSAEHPRRPGRTGGQKQDEDILKGEARSFIVVV